VIARRIGPFPEIVEQAHSGLLFSTKEELLSGMHRFQSDPLLREQHVRRGYDAFVEHWSESAVLPRYLELVRDVARRKGRHELLEVLGTPASSNTLHHA
jgi:glycosyltransferase involved in cell wall biosynthesis